VLIEIGDLRSRNNVSLKPGPGENAERSSAAEMFDFGRALIQIQFVPEHTLWSYMIHNNVAEIPQYLNKNVTNALWAYFVLATLLQFAPNFS